MFSTRGMPMRSDVRRAMAATRAFAAFVHARAGTGSAILAAPRARNGSFAAISTKLGFALRIASNPDLIPRMSLTSSTDPFSATGFGDPILISMKVRRQLFLQKLQRVDSLRVVL